VSLVAAAGEIQLGVTIHPVEPNVQHGHHGDHITSRSRDEPTDHPCLAETRIRTITADLATLYSPNVPRWRMAIQEEFHPICNQLPLPFLCFRSWVARDGLDVPSSLDRDSPRKHLVTFEKQARSHLDKTTRRIKAQGFESTRNMHDSAHTDYGNTGGNRDDR